MVINKGKDLKEIKYLMTPGVQALGLTNQQLIQLYKAAIDHKNQTDMVVLCTAFDTTSVQDGNGIILKMLEKKVLPETLWVIADEYESFVSYTAMLPEEY